MKNYGLYCLAIIVLFFILFACKKNKEASGIMNKGGVVNSVCFTNSNDCYWLPLGSSHNHFNFFKNPCLYVDNADNIYVSHWIETAYSGPYGNPYEIYNIAKWNGDTWSPIKTNGYVYTMYVDASNNLYAAGGFIDDLQKYYVAKWNGSTWTEIGGTGSLDFTSPIYFITGDVTGNIYAGGANGKVAKWDGTNWTYFPTLNGDINSVCCTKKGSLLASGSFTNAAGKRYVAVWDDSAWVELGSGNNALNADGNILTMVADDIGNIYVGGSFKNQSGSMYIAKWNGTTWQELGGNNSLNANNTICTICRDINGNLYAAGWFNAPYPRSNYNSGIAYRYEYVAKYDGTRWLQLGEAVIPYEYSPNSVPYWENPIHSICVDAKGNVYATASTQSYQELFNKEKCHVAVHYATP